MFVRSLDQFLCVHSFGVTRLKISDQSPGETPMSKGQGCLSSRLVMQISDFGLTWGVLGKTPLYLAIKVVRRNIKIYIFFNSFCLLHSCNQSLKWSLLVGPRPNWSPLRVFFKISDEHLSSRFMW